MREKLNSDPKAQVALVVLLVAAAGFMLMKATGGGEEKTAESVPVVATVNGVTATGASPGEAVEGAVQSLEAGTAAASSAPTTLPTSVPTPPLPRPVTSAYDAGKTVVLLIVDPGGINDGFVVRAATLLTAARNVAAFVVPANEIARYAAITVGVNVNQVPALVVMRPRELSEGTPQASVEYGFQTPQSIVQAVLDASYEGPETTYHPN